MREYSNIYLTSMGGQPEARDFLVKYPIGAPLLLRSDGVRLDERRNSSQFDGTDVAT